MVSCAVEQLLLQEDDELRGFGELEKHNMVREGMLFLDGEEQKVRCGRQYGASSLDLYGNLLPDSCVMKAHAVLTNLWTYGQASE